MTFDAGKNKAPNLKEGDARIVVEAVSDDFRGSTDSASANVKVVLAPPRVTADDRSTTSIRAAWNWRC